MNPRAAICLCAAVALVAAMCTFSSPARAALYGVDWDAGGFYQVSSSNAALSFMGNTGVPQLADLQYNPYDGRMYAFNASFNGSSLYRIDPQTGAATLIGGTGFIAVEGGLAFGPGGMAYAVSALPNGAVENGLFTMDLNTGAGTMLGVLQGGYQDLNGLAYRPDGMLVGLGGGSGSNALMLIDPHTFAISMLAPLRPAVGGVGGMAVDGGVAYFCTAGAGSGGSDQLFTFDMYSGSYSLVGSFGHSATAVGMSGLTGMPTVPEPRTLVLVGVGLVGLLALRRKA
jgi:hypothetical protein